jgi:riboflavin biosynthesis pyrimidine reductase
MKPHVVCHMLISLDGRIQRVTMAEMSKADAHPPDGPFVVTRPHHFARPDADTYAIAFDRSGKLHFSKPDIGGDHVVVLLGPGVPDSHLAELTKDGVSYVVAPDDAMDAKPLLELLGRELGIERLLVDAARCRDLREGHCIRLAPRGLP